MPPAKRDGRTYRHHNAARLADVDQGRGVGGSSVHEIGRNVWQSFRDPHSDLRLALAPVRDLSDRLRLSVSAR